MNKTEARKYLATLLVPRAEGLEGKCYRTEYMHDTHAAYPVQKAVSDAAFNSGLSFEFSYRIVENAIGVLCDVEEWDNDDALTEAIDQAMPVYYSDLMQIYVADWEVVDEACEEIGPGVNDDSVKRAQLGWYSAIRDMVYAIRHNLDAVIEMETV